MLIYTQRSSSTVKTSYSNKNISAIKNLVLLLTLNTRYFGRANHEISRKNTISVAMQQIISYWYDYDIGYNFVQPIYKGIDDILFNEEYLKSNNVIYGFLDRMPMLIIEYYAYNSGEVMIADLPIARKRKNIFYKIKLGSIKRFKINY